MADPVFRLKKFVAQGLFEKASAVVPAKDILPVLKNFQVEVKSAARPEPRMDAMPTARASWRRVCGCLLFMGGMW